MLCVIPVQATIPRRLSGAYQSLGLSPLKFVVSDSHLVNATDKTLGWTPGKGHCRGDVQTVKQGHSQKFVLGYKIFGGGIKLNTHVQ